MKPAPKFFRIKSVARTVTPSAQALTNNGLRPAFLQTGMVVLLLEDPIARVVSSWVNNSENAKARDEALRTGRLDYARVEYVLITTGDPAECSVAIPTEDLEAIDPVRLMDDIIRMLLG